MKIEDYMEKRSCECSSDGCWFLKGVTELDLGYKTKEEAEQALIGRIKELEENNEQGS
tara:strand:- start:2186 stop:2359 length:174 start_codon:yes stop_codon:yes gene_type:complete